MDTVDKIAMEQTGKPASACIRRWIETGLKQGYQEGYQEGYQLGYQEGYQLGLRLGLCEGGLIKRFIYNSKLRGVPDLEIKHDLVDIFEFSEEEASKILFENEKN